MPKHKEPGWYRECIYCGTATGLKVQGVPVCEPCAADLEAGRNPEDRELSVELHTDDKEEIRPD